MPTTPSATPPVHTKTDHRPGALDVEAAGLAWLADAAARHGGAPVLPLVSAPPGAAGIPGVPVPPGPAGQLRTVRLPSGRPDAAAAEAFGRLLARTHAAGAPWFGAPPAGWAHDGVMGDAPLPLRQEPPAAPATPGAPDDGAAPDGSVTAGAPPHDGTGWGEFYATDRLLPYLPAARPNGSLDADDERLIRRLADRLATGALDHPLPELVRTPAARLHGDLWSGNVLWTTDPGLLPDTPGLAEARAAVAASPRPTVGVLIDPAAQGGHAESDLAQLFVFGAPHAPRIVAAYDEVSPLAGGPGAGGFRDRLGLHQLHILIVHAALFGGSYGPQTTAAAARYL